MSTTYEDEVEEVKEETDEQFEACAHCGAEGVATFPVSDNDESVGYYSTIFVCARCS
jgi:hypothetical protein